MEKPCGALWGMVGKHPIPSRIEAPSGSEFLLKGLCGACMRNTETPAGFKRKGWSIRPQTGCRDSVFETAKSKAIPWQTLARFKPQAEANSSSKGSVGHACETGKPQQESSARGGQVANRRAAETASSKPLQAKQNHGKPWQDSSLTRKPMPPQRVVWGMHARQGNPSRIQAQGVFNSSPDGLPKQHLRNR